MDERDVILNSILVFVVDFFRTLSDLPHGAPLRKGCPVCL